MKKRKARILVLGIGIVLVVASLALIPHHHKPSPLQPCWQLDLQHDIVAVCAGQQADRIYVLTDKPSLLALSLHGELLWQVDTQLATNIYFRQHSN